MLIYIDVCIWVYIYIYIYIFVGLYIYVCVFVCVRVIYVCLGYIYSSAKCCLLAFHDSFDPER